MEQYLRIALCLVLLTGYLQAKPCPKSVPSDLCFECLRENVSCVQNVTFISPTNVKEHCHNAALMSFKKELERARGRPDCSDKEDRTGDTLNSLDNYKIEHSQDTNSTECKWENEGSRKQFADFVKDFEDFIQLLQSKTCTN